VCIIFQFFSSEITTEAHSVDSVEQVNSAWPSLRG